MDILCNPSSGGNGRALTRPWVERVARVVGHATRMLAALDPVERRVVMENVERLIAEDRR